MNIMKLMKYLTPALLPLLALSMVTTPLHAAKKASRKKKAAPAATSPEPSLPVKGIDRSTPPPAGPLPEIKLPAATTETLPNGLRLIALQDKRQPTVTYRLLIKSGSLFDGEKPGLASLVASLLNKGTGELSADEFAQKTDFLGMRVEASASDDAISLGASGLSRDAVQLLDFLRQAALEPAFRKEEVEKEKLRVMSELAQKKANPSDLAMRLRNKLLYGKHPYGAYATPESVNSISDNDLKAFHKANFIPNNATLAIVGDLPPDEAIAAVKKAFGEWKKAELPTLHLGSTPAEGDARMTLPAFPELKGITYHLVDRPVSVQSNVLVSGRGVPRDNPDLPELNVVNSVLGGGFSGRLFGNLREKNGYTYGAYSGFGSRKLGGAFSATAEVRNAVTADAIKEIFNELKRITTDAIGDEELALQRNYLSGNYLLSLESDRRIAERLQEIDLYDLPADYYQNYAQRLTSVTPEKALELAKEYLHPEDLAVVVVGNAAEVLPQLRKLGPVTLYDADLKEMPLPEETKETKEATEEAPSPAK